MKKLLFLTVTFCWVTFCFAQDEREQRIDYTQLKTPQLIQLYEEAKQLENSTPAQIEANRLAIKNAWMEIDPAIGNLYKPVETYGKLPEIPENVHINGLHSTGDEGDRFFEDNSQNRWGTDIQIYSGFVDGGVDVITDNLGHIYALHYISFGTDHRIFVHRSTDDGDTWTLYREQVITAPILQAQLMSIHGTGDNYLLVYFLTDTNTFQALRWNTTTNSALQAQVVATNVSEFSVDRNYPVATSGQRVFAIYKPATNPDAFIISSRSTAGSFGFDFVDESAGLFNFNSLDLAYGRDGASYLVGLGPVSGNIRFLLNTDLFDPTAWSGASTIEDGSVRESANPTIIAARNALATDNVIIFTSSRATGSTGNFDGRWYRRTNNGAFGSGNAFSSGGSNFSIIYPDSYMRFINGTTTARLSYVRQVIDASSNNQNRSLTYNGTDFDPLEPVADPGNNPFSGFKSTVTGEILSTNEPYIVFAGTSGGGTFGANLYFDKQSSTLSTVDFDLADIQVYPNPTNDILTVKASQSIDQIEIYNYMGQLLKTIKPNTTIAEVTMDSFAAGIYLVKISSQEKSITHKIIKK